MYFVYFREVPILFCVLVYYSLELFHEFAIASCTVHLHELFYFANEPICVPFRVLIVDAHCIAPPSLLQYKPSTVVSVEFVPFA